MKSHDDTALRLAALEAIRGAHQLRERLLIQLSSGNPSVADKAYAFKVRVKDDLKIQEKVQRKRAGGRKYDVGDLRDIVGLRVVTLYRLEALDLVPMILDAILAPAPGSVFKAGSLEEIRIYSINAQGDPQRLAEKLTQLFAQAGLGHLGQVEEAPSNYTSIHMVAWAAGGRSEQPQDIPIEIQVRTAFEDVWGEVDHALKYKQARGTEVDDPILLGHLNVLKTLVDGVSQYADQIRIGITDPDRDRLRASGSRAVEEPLTRLAPLTDLPEALKSEIEDAVATAKPALEAGPAMATPDRQRILQESLRRLEGAAASLAEAKLRAATVREVDFVVSMQRALMLFEVGNLLEDGQAQLEQATKIYEEMEAKFPKRLPIKYRLAKALDALGDREGAIEKLREVTRRLEEPREPLPKTHWIRAAAPRVLGVLLWEEADALGRSEPGWSSARLSLLKEAYETTEAAHARRVKEETNGGAAGPSERAKAANNLLYYALEFAEAAKSAPVKDEAGPKDDAIVKLLEEMNATEPSEIVDARFLDTAIRAFLHLGDTERARLASERFLELAPKQFSRAELDGLHLQEMIARASATLAQG